MGGSGWVSLGSKLVQPPSCSTAGRRGRKVWGAALQMPFPSGGGRAYWGSIGKLCPWVGPPAPNGPTEEKHKGPSPLWWKIWHGEFGFLKPACKGMQSSQLWGPMGPAARPHAKFWPHGLGMSWGNNVSHSQWGPGPAAPSTRRSWRFTA